MGKRTEDSGLSMVMGVVAIGGVIFFLWTLAFFSMSSMGPSAMPVGSAIQ